MRCAGFVAILALTACTFSSETAFFSDSDATHPIADGARYSWQAPGDEAPMEVTFHRRGAAYEVIARDHPDEPMRDVVLVAVPDTPEDDYIVQWKPESAETERTYAFMWPTDDGYRVFSAPSTFEPAEGEAAQPTFCEVRQYGECVFASRERLLAYYRAIAYPRLVANSEALEVTLTIAPLDGN